MAINFGPVGPASRGLSLNEPTAGQSIGAAFQSEMMQALAQVNDQINKADLAGQQMLTGASNDVSVVMVESTKAQLALELTIQLRNKVLEAYQEIMRMQI